MNGATSGWAAVLGQVCAGRDNHLNLIRLLAALGVLAGHAWPLTLGRGATEPLSDLLGVSLGTTCVYVFFSLSGFLVSRSFERQARVRDWIRARAYRLVPGLFVVLLLSVGVLGPLLTALPAGAYLARRETWTYLPVNQVMVLQQHGLPGVFETNPFRGVVNGSLWTLRYEVLCYLGVLGAGLLGAFRRRGLLAAGLGGVVLAGLLLVEGPAAGRAPRALRDAADLALPFAIGVGFHAWRDRVRLHPLGLLLLAGAAAAAWGSPAYRALFTAALAYVVFWAGFVPKGPLLAFNRLGDASYGVYLYAFPVQQVLARLFPAWGPWMNLAVAAPLTLLLGALSWRFVEKPALDRVRKNT
jgi:peptidoglycan/LPS O-acetylase OafA/YrhL